MAQSSGEVSGRGPSRARLTFRNSKILHEGYFANLGGSGKRSSPIEDALSAAYQTSAR